MLLLSISPKLSYRLYYLESISSPNLISCQQMLLYEAEKGVLE